MKGTMQMPRIFWHPTPDVKARHDKWRKCLSDTSHRDLVGMTLKAYDRLSPDIIVIPEGHAKFRDVCTSEYDYEPPKHRLKREVEFWLFQNDIPWLFHEQLSILRWPEEPENEPASFRVNVVEFRSDVHVVHFKLRWL
jgi:hypothetical protein